MSFLLPIIELLKFNSDNSLEFSSVLFISLFSLFFCLYAVAIKKKGLRNLLLLAFSLYFYFKVSGLFVIVLILLATSDYFLGLWIFYVNKDWIKKLLVGISLVINLGYLSYFKYADFLMNSLGLDNSDKYPLLQNILMPIGISYFVFKTLTYIFDLYRERIEKPELNYINYLLYVSFFPNILAGPISRARDLLPQFKKDTNITEEQIGQGFFLIIAGAFKKIVLSDYIAANFSDRVFANPNLFSGFENLMASYGATIQIYCDFSGYTDIVIGIAMLMGFTIEANFNKPFKAQNISDFWRRWHITLSNWMNEYLFYPLSFSLRKFKMLGALIAVMLTFLISGLWHGPNWTFILWGCSHGLAIVWDVISQNVRDKIKKKMKPGLYRFISIFITLNFLSLSIILFRSANLDSAFLMYEQIFTRFNISMAPEWLFAYYMPFIMIIIAYTLHYLPQKTNDITTSLYIKMPLLLKILFTALAIILIYQCFSTDAQPFIYLEF